MIDDRRRATRLVVDGRRHLAASISRFDIIFTEVQIMTDRPRARRRILKWAGGLGLLGAFGIPVATRAEERETASSGIVGSWIVSIAYASETQHTRGLATFNSDSTLVGSITAYETTPVHPTPSRGTTLHGSWRRNKGPSYTVAAARLHLDEHGTLLGTMQTQLSLTLAQDRNSWHGTFQFDAISPTGTVVRSGHGRVHATRIQVDAT
jgi:hypothetical protein